MKFQCFLEDIINRLRSNETCDNNDSKLIFWQHTNDNCIVERSIQNLILALNETSKQTKYTKIIDHVTFGSYFLRTITRSCTIETQYQFFHAIAQNFLNLKTVTFVFATPFLTTDKQRILQLLNVKLLASFLQKASNLKKLELSDLSDDSGHFFNLDERDEEEQAAIHFLHDVIRNHPMLQDLELINCCMEEDTAIRLALYLFPQGEGLFPNVTIESPDTCIDLALLQKMVDSAKLKSISFHFVPFFDQHVRTMVNGLLCPKTKSDGSSQNGLKSLHLNQCFGLNANGVMAISELLQQQIPNNSKDRAASSLFQLEELTLYNNGIDDNGYLVIANALLPHSSVSTRDTTNVAHTTTCGLKRLVLHEDTTSMMGFMCSNTISDQGTGRFLEVMRQNFELQEVQINPLSDKMQKKMNHMHQIQKLVKQEEEKISTCLSTSQDELSLFIDTLVSMEQDLDGIFSLFSMKPTLVQNLLESLD